MVEKPTSGEPLLKKARTGETSASDRMVKKSSANQPVEEARVVEAESPTSRIAPSSSSIGAHTQRSLVTPTSAQQAMETPARLLRLYTDRGPGTDFNACCLSGLFPSTLDTPADNSLLGVSITTFRELIKTDIGIAEDEVLFVHTKRGLTKVHNETKLRTLLLEAASEGRHEANFLLKRPD